MADEELPKEKAKEINGMQLTNVKISKIAMIYDYLVLDRFNDISSFFGFEKCFGLLLSKEDPNLLIETFHRAFNICIVNGKKFFPILIF